MADHNYFDNRGANVVGSIAGGNNSFSTGAAPASPDPERGSPERPWNRRVFVIHGRDEQIRLAMFDFLRALDVQPLGWERMVNATGSPVPHVLDIVRKGFELAAAVVVLLTPDDIAELHESLRRPDDPGYESAPAGQPRQNALFEAGMAMGMQPLRTIVVRVGRVRPFTDVDGLDFILLDGSAEKLKNIAQRLNAAGCRADTNGDDWLDTRRFAGLAAFTR